MRRRGEDDRGPLILLPGDQRLFATRGVRVPPFMMLVYADEQPISLLTPKSDRVAELLMNGMLFSRDQVNEALRVARRRGLPLMTWRWYNNRMRETGLPDRDPMKALWCLVRDLERPMIGPVESAGGIACVQIYRALEPFCSEHLENGLALIFSIQDLKAEIDRLHAAGEIDWWDWRRLHRYAPRLHPRLPQHTPKGVKRSIRRLGAMEASVRV